MNSFTDIFRIAALPLDTKWGDKEANLKAVEESLKYLPAGTDLLVLPELFSTGYSDDPAVLDELSEKNTGETVDRLRAWAAEKECAIAGSFMARTAHHVYNRGFIIEPNGDETFYDKRHLFSLSNEATNFVRGEKTMPIVRFRGWNIGLVVCYDLRFPAWCRCRDKSYDILLVPANWPNARKYAFEHLLIARAIENQAAVVGANRGGEDVFGDYRDLTRIYDCRGYDVGKKDETSPFVTATLSRAEQDKYRQGFPALSDADDFNIL